MTKLNCVKCLQAISATSLSRLCRNCWKNEPRKSKGLCSICKKTIHMRNYSSGLCRACFNSSQINAKLWCIDCGNKLPGLQIGRKRCRSCWRSFLNSNRKFWQNYNWLYEHYVLNKESLMFISSITGSSSTSIKSWLHDLKIPRRTRGETRIKGVRKGKGGYILIHQPGHPRAGQNNYIPEHILVMEQHIGRYVNREEAIHHKNGINTDNRIDNLQLFKNNSEHIKHEQTINKFCKLLLWNNLKPKLTLELQDLFTQFVNERPNHFC